MTANPQILLKATLPTQALLQATLTAIESVGLCSRQALMEAGCSVEDVEKGDFDFFNVRLRLLAYGRRKSGNALFALHAGNFVRLEHLGIYGLLLKSGFTLADAIDQVARLIPVMPKPYSELRLRPALNRVEVEMPPAITLDSTMASIAPEYMFSSIYRGAPMLSGWPVHFERVAFAHPPSTCISKYEDFFQCNVAFNAEKNICTIVADPGKPFYFANSALFLELKSLLSRYSTQHSAVPDEVAKIRKLIAAETLIRRPSEHRIAKKLSVSESTLRRRLSACGTTFQKELDNALRDAAIQMLNDEDREIKSIAIILGYSDPSAFHRAFKRWTGITPTQFKTRYRR